MEHLIEVAKGDRPADLLLRGARIVNVFTGEVYLANIAIAGEWIAGVGEDYTEGQRSPRLGRTFFLPRV